MQMVPFTFRSIEELELGPKWAAVFEERWPHYQEWFLREGEAARPSYATSVRMLRAHMPELMPAYERVVELAGGGDLAARMLSLYRPPPYLAACSQGVWSRDGGPMLVRNYDYAPSRIEGIIWSTRLSERRVIGMSDCLWGLLDGMNDAGLAVSLTFGGRRVLGDGFGIPLVVRYLLETCDDVASARAALARLPYALAHNLTVVDRAGEVLTAYLSPDREPIFRDVPGGDEPSGDRGVAGAGPRDPHDRARTLHHRSARRSADDRRRRSRTRSCGRRCSARRTRAASARCTRPPTGRPKGPWTIDGHRSRGGWGSTRSSRASTPRRWRKDRSPRARSLDFRMGVHRRCPDGTLRRERRRGHHHGEREYARSVDAHDPGHRRRRRDGDRFVPDLGDRERELRPDREAIGIDPSQIPAEVRAQGTVSVTGWEGGDGKWTLVAGVIVVVAAGLLVMASSRRVVAIVMIVGGVVGGGLALYDATLQKDDAIDNVAGTFAGIGLPGALRGLLLALARHRHLALHRRRRCWPSWRASSRCWLRRPALDVGAPADRGSRHRPPPPEPVRAGRGVRDRRMSVDRRRPRRGWGPGARAESVDAARARSSPAAWNRTADPGPASPVPTKPSPARPDVRSVEFQVDTSDRRAVDVTDRVRGFAADGRWRWRRAGARVRPARDGRRGADGDGLRLRRPISTSCSNGSCRGTTGTRTVTGPSATAAITSCRSSSLRP